MKSFAMTLSLKDDPTIIEQYVEYHRNTWPEGLDGLKGLGITSMKNFLHGRRLFMSLDAPRSWLRQQIPTLGRLLIFVRRSRQYAAKSLATR